MAQKQRAPFRWSIFDSSQNIFSSPLFLSRKRGEKGKRNVHENVLNRIKNAPAKSQREFPMQARKNRANPQKPYRAYQDEI